MSVRDEGKHAEGEEVVQTRRRAAVYMAVYESRPIDVVEGLKGLYKT